MTITKEAIARITDADFPADGDSIVFLDGYFFAYASNGTIYQSDSNDPSSWVATNVINADYSGDGIKCIFRHGNYIVVAGETGTIQYFYNAGNPTGSVLSVAENLTVTGLNILAAPVNTSVGSFFVGSSASSQAINTTDNVALYRLTGVNTYEKVSDDVWSGIIKQSAITRVGLAEIGDKSLLLLHATSATAIIAYDFNIKQFSVITMDDAITSSFGVYFTKSGSTSLFSWAAGNTWTDSSAAYTLTIQTEPQDMNNGMDATDTWADLLADTESSGTTALDYTDDDYVTWNPFGAGTFDMTVNKKRITGGGTHNIRAYRLTHSANTGFRAQILRINHVKGDV